MTGRLDAVFGTFVIGLVMSACGSSEPQFNDAWVKKNWPESGRAYASFKVQGNMKGWGEGCVVHNSSPYSELDLLFKAPDSQAGTYTKSPFDECSKTASVKKWYIRDDYLVGTFRCSFTAVVDGEVKNITGEVGQEVFIDESPVEEGGWRNRGSCSIALFDADAPTPIGFYADDSFPDYKREDVKEGKAIEVLVN